MERFLYIQVVGRRIEIVTDKGTYDGSLLQQLERLLKPYGFYRVDHNKLANMNEVIYLDKINKLIYFDEQRMLNCPVSRRKLVNICKEFDK